MKEFFKMADDHNFHHHEWSLPSLYYISGRPSSGESCTNIYDVDSLNPLSLEKGGTPGWISLL